MPSLVCAYPSCTDAYRDSKDTHSSNRLVLIQPCSHKDVYAHRGCNARISKSTLKCTSCLNRLSTGDIMSASGKHAKARLSDWVDNPLGEAGRFVGRSIDRTIGIVESSNPKPRYHNEDQRKGGAFVSGFINDRSRPVTSYESAVGRRSGQVVETGMKVYSKGKPVYQVMAPTATKLIRR